MQHGLQACQLCCPVNNLLDYTAWNAPSDGLVAHAFVCSRQGIISHEQHGAKGQHVSAPSATLAGSAASASRASMAMGTGSSGCSAGAAAGPAWAGSLLGWELSSVSYSDPVLPELDSSSLDDEAAAPAAAGVTAAGAGAAAAAAAVEGGCSSSSSSLSDSSASLDEVGASEDDNAGGAPCRAPGVARWARVLICLFPFCASQPSRDMRPGN